LILLYRPQNNQSVKQKDVGKSATKIVSKPNSASSTGGVNNSSSVSENVNTPRPPSDEFLKWCKQALRGLDSYAKGVMIVEMDDIYLIVLYFIKIFIYKFYILHIYSIFNK